MAKKKLSEEELKRRKKESQAKWKSKNPERYRESKAKWNKNHPEYYKEYFAVYRQEHKESIAEYEAKRYQDNKEEILEQQSKWRESQMGRAHMLACNYDRNDKKYNRGKCTLTPIWIVDNIFPMPCHYCGAMGWEIMGCDRVDNSKPHTPDNVVPCCAECNRKRGSKSYEEFVEETMYVNKMEDISPMPS